MYELALNGLRTKPGLPGAGFAVGNCEAAVVPELFLVGDVAAVLEVVPADPWVGFRAAARGVGDETGTGRPGWLTSDAFGGGVGSGELKT